MEFDKSLEEALQTLEARVQQLDLAAQAVNEACSVIKAQTRHLPPIPARLVSTYSYGYGRLASACLGQLKRHQSALAKTLARAREFEEPKKAPARSVAPQFDQVSPYGFDPVYLDEPLDESTVNQVYSLSEPFEEVYQGTDPDEEEDVNA